MIEVNIDYDNPNEYDDETFTKGSIAMVNAVATLVEAGASGEDIANEVTNALDNAGITS